MTLIVIGPVTRDLVVIGENKSQRIGGATYFQSFVFEEFFPDYLAVVNCDDESFAKDFPDPDKVKVIVKDDTHFFVNSYPFADNLDVREQSSNFADVPIYPGDLESVLPDDIDGFVLNPLNRSDFPAETVEYVKSFGVPVFMSVQGFLRQPDVKVNENYTIKLEYFDELPSILSGVDAIFIDEAEASIIGGDFDVDEMVITDGSNGSRIISTTETRIDAVECEKVVDSTGCGDTYMAAYITQKIQRKSPETCGNFASSIASKKIEINGPYKSSK